MHNEKSYYDWQSLGLLRKENVIEDPELKRIFTEKINSLPRIETTIEVPEIVKEFEQGWFYTLLEDTCAAAATLTGMLSMGVEIEQGLLTRLYKTAATKDTPDILFSGMSITQLQKILEETPDSAIKIKKMKSPAIMQDLYRRVIVNGEEEEFEGFFSDVYEKYVTNLLSVLSTGNIVLANVDFFNYSGRNKGSYHALIVVGIRKEEKQVDVQIVDPNKGVLWIPIEHLINSEIDQYALEKKT